MAAVYSSRLLQQKGGNSGYSFVVPAGNVLVVRDFDAYADVIAAANVFMEGAVGQTIFWGSWSIGGQGVQQWRGRQVLVAGETLSVSCLVGPLDGIDFTVSGYLLTA